MINLSTSPPPLPDEAGETPGNPGSLGAGLGLFLALAAIAGSYGYDLWLQTREVSEGALANARLVVGAMCVGFAVLGAICSFMAFFGRRNGGAGLFMMAALGIVLNGGVAGLTLTGGVGAIRAHASSLGLQTQNARATQSLGATVQEIQEDIKKDFEADGHIDGDRSHADKFAQGLDTLEKSSTGDTARAARALKNFMAEIEGEVSGYQAEVQKLANLDPMDPTRLKTKADLQMRQGVLASFTERNERLAKVMEEAIPRLQRHLAAEGVSEQSAREVVAGASQNLEERLEIIRNIREADRQIAGSLSEILGLYEAHWQAWKTDAGGQSVGFDDPKATADIQRLIQSVEQASSEQSYWQGRYVETLK